MQNQTLNYTETSKIPERLSAGWNALVYPAQNGVRLLYQLYLPQNFDRSKQYPLLLYMHSSGVRCDDNSHIYTAEAKFLRNFEASQYKDAAIVLAPCCPKTDKWVGVERWDSETFDANSLPQTAHMQAAIELFSDARTNLSVDPTRLYTVGLSMGAFAVWDMLARYRHTFAAAIPVAGAGSPAQAAQMTGTAIWIFHGTKDAAVPYASALAMQKVLIGAGMRNLRFDAFEGAGHGIWTRMADTKGLCDWLFSQKRSDLS